MTETFRIAIAVCDRFGIKPDQQRTDLLAALKREIETARIAQERKP